MQTISISAIQPFSCKAGGLKDFPKEVATVQKRSVVGGFVFGGLILAVGLALIFSKDWVWSLFEAFYSMLGIEAQRTNLWEMFITTIGLGVSAIGLFTIWVVWQRWRIGR